MAEMEPVDKDAKPSASAVRAKRKIPKNFARYQNELKAAFRIRRKKPRQRKKLDYNWDIFSSE